MLMFIYLGFVHLATSDRLHQNMLPVDQAIYSYPMSRFRTMQPCLRFTYTNLYGFTKPPVPNISQSSSSLSSDTVI